MKKIANQILYNLKKEKTSFISFGVIILITALILNCAAVLLCQVDRAYDSVWHPVDYCYMTQSGIIQVLKYSAHRENTDCFCPAFNLTA